MPPFYYILTTLRGTLTCYDYGHHIPYVAHPEGLYQRLVKPLTLIHLTFINSDNDSHKKSVSKSGCCWLDQLLFTLTSSFSLSHSLCLKSPNLLKARLLLSVLLECWSLRFSLVDSTQPSTCHLVCLRDVVLSHRTSTLSKLQFKNIPHPRTLHSHL